MNEDETKLARHELAGELLDSLLAQDDDFGAQMRELALAWGGTEGVGSEDISGGERGSSLRRSVLRLADFLRSLEDPQHWWDELCALTELDPENFDPAHPLLRSLERMLRDRQRIQISPGGNDFIGRRPVQQARGKCRRVLFPGTDRVGDGERHLRCRQTEKLTHGIAVSEQAAQYGKAAAAHALEQHATGTLKLPRDTGQLKDRIDFGSHPDQLAGMIEKVDAAIQV